MTSGNDEFEEQKRILLTSLHGYVAPAPELGRPDTGGQVVFVLEVAKKLAELGYRVDVVTRQFENQLEMEVINYNTRIWRIPYGGSKFIRKEDQHEYLYEFIRNFLEATRLKGIRYHFAYSHYWDAGWATQRIAEVLDIPHIHVPHSLGKWKKRLNKTASGGEAKYRYPERILKESQVFRKCDYLIATSHEQSDILQNEYGVNKQKIAVIPAGMNAVVFQPLPAKEKKKFARRHDLRPHDVLILGRIAHNKGYDLAVHMLKSLLKVVPDARLVAAIGGKDSQRDLQKMDELKRFAKEQGVYDNISWRGYVRDEHLAGYYSCCGAFALTSRYEPFGMTAVEAMASGAPTVITSHSGLSQFVEPEVDALVADPNDAKAYAKACAKILTDASLAKSLAKQGCQKARQNFSWASIVHDTETLAESVIQATSFVESEVNA